MRNGQGKSALSNEKSRDDMQRHCDIMRKKEFQICTI